MMITKDVLRILVMIDKDKLNKEGLLYSHNGMLLVKYTNKDSKVVDSKIGMIDKPIYIGIDISFMIKLLRNVEETFEIDNRFNNITINGWSLPSRVNEKPSDIVTRDNILYIVSGKSKSELRTMAFNRLYDRDIAESVLSGKAVELTAEIVTGTTSKQLQSNKCETRFITLTKDGISTLKSVYGNVYTHNGYSFIIHKDMDENITARYKASDLYTGLLVIGCKTQAEAIERAESLYSNSDNVEYAKKRAFEMLKGVTLPVNELDKPKETIQEKEKTMLIQPNNPVTFENKPIEPVEVKPIETIVPVRAAFAEIVKQLKSLSGIEIALIGSWLWVTGETYQYKETIKDLGFAWSKTRKAWYLTDNGSKWHGKHISKFNNLEEVKQAFGTVSL